MFSVAKPMTLNKAAFMAKPSTINARNARFIVRSAEESAPKVAESDNAESTVFYAGKNYSAEEWKDAVANGTVAPAPPSPAAVPIESAVSIGDLMAFSGAPELINGRLAMIAFVSAVAAELSSGESVLKQVADEPTGIVLTFAVFTAASLIPLLNSAKKEAFGPFSPAAEMTNGRAAMLGFAALLLVEGFKGSALF